jgi:glycosyltransferase involved in cell wall biosynthesis
MKSGKHIVLLSPGFAAHEEDHTCIPPLQAYLPALQERFPHLKISLIALQYPYRRGQYVWQGYDIFAAGGRNRRLLKPLTWQRARHQFARLHRTLPVDLIHSFWLREATWLGSKIAQKHHIPQVATIMGQDALSSNRYLRRLDFASMQVTAISERAATEFSQNTKQPLPPVISWGLSTTDLDWQAPPQTQRPIDLIGVGSLVLVKNWPRFVRIVARLAEKRPDLKAAIVGEGPERPRLEKMIRDLKLENHLELRGEVSRPAALELMSQSKVLLHTATYEGQGYVFPEALSRGAHIVSTPVGMVENGPKIAVRPDTVTLAKAALEYLEQPVDQLPHPTLTIAQTVEGFSRLYETLA